MTRDELADALADLTARAHHADGLDPDTRAAVLAHLDAAADTLDGTTPTTDRPARPAPRSLIGGALDTDRGAGITIGQPRRRPNRRD